MAELGLAIVNALQAVGIAYIAYLAARTRAAVNDGNDANAVSVQALTDEVRNGNGHAKDAS